MAKSVSQLKNQARREEQRENWSRAIELYGEAIRLSEETGEVSLDLSLYNRIGDLYRRQGDIDQAVHHYMEAVDQYADQGLHTGAIALCNKIHRLAPDKVEVFRNLGRLYAATGLVAEARNSFRQFIDHMEEVGDDVACRDARLELARLTGDREMLLETTARMAEGEEEERESALEALLDLWNDVGDDEDDEELRRQIRALDPEIDLGEAEHASGQAAAAAATETDGPATSGAEDEAEVPAADEGPAPEAAGDERPETAAERETESGSEEEPPPEDEAGWAADLSDVLLDVELSEGLDTTLEDAAAPGDERKAPGEETSDGAATEPAAAEEGPEQAPEPEPDAAEKAGAEPDEQGYVDLGERIRRRLEAEAPPEDAEDGAAASEYDFDDMLVGFRVQVDETEGEADPAAHLELGVALRQMGLLDDAIREFQVALRSADPPLRAFELLGEAFIEKGLHGVAVRVLTRALHLPGHSDYELLGVLYQLGIAHQTEANHEQALDCFERVYSIDIDFRDVAERMEAVRLEG